MPGPDFLPLTAMKGEHVRRDMHVHSMWTDGRLTLEEIVNRAEALGLREVAFSDHVRATSTYCMDYAAAIASLRAKATMELYIAFEAKVLGPDGSLDIASDCLAVADFTIGSVHSFPGPDGLVRPEDASQRDLARAELELGLALACGGEARVLGHPGGMSLKRFGVFPARSFRALAQACAASGTAFEINVRYHAPVLPLLLDILRETGAPVSVGSDVHAPEELGRCAALLEPFFQKAA